MRNYQIPQGDWAPMWLKASEIENPLQVLSGFFQLHPLSSSRCFLWEMFNSALKNTQDWQQSQMSAREMTNFTTGLMSLMEAAELVSLANDSTDSVMNYTMVEEAIATVQNVENCVTFQDDSSTPSISKLNKEAESFELNVYLNIIQERLDVEKIYLIETYGSMEAGMLEIDLLVLVNDQQEGRLEVIENEINTILRDWSRPNVSLLKIGKAAELIKSGNPYLSYLCNADKKLFDKGNYNTFNGRHNYPVMDIALIGNAHDSLMKLAVEYLGNAKSYYEAEQYDLSLFMLYQSTECSLSAVWNPLYPDFLRVRNLNKLFRGIRALSPAIYNVFPRNSNDEKMIFQRLQRAYVHARYKTGYVIGAQPTLALIERVEKLQQIIKDTFIEIAANCLQGYPTHA